MKHVRGFLDFIRYLFRPQFWVSNYPVNDTWDRILNELIDHHSTVEIQGEYTLSLDGVVVWISNYPYAFGYNYKRPGQLPRRRTREKLMDLVIQTVSKRADMK